MMGGDPCGRLSRHYHTVYTRKRRSREYKVETLAVALLSITTLIPEPHLERICITPMIAPPITAVQRLRTTGTTA
jgi:hypothetical protein